MAVHFRFPVLAWQDLQGGWTARLADRDLPAGTGRTLALALDQVQDHLEWLYGRDPYLDGPDFDDPELLLFKVPVRPEYEVADRRFPLDEPITLHVHAVRGTQRHGLRVCSLPLLEQRFYYHPGDSLKSLVPHYVQRTMEGRTPADLARFLPPRAASLESVNVTVRPRLRKSPRRQDAETLAGIAEDMADAWFRRQFSRPYERDREAGDLVRRLRDEKASVLLVGEPGSGKTTVLVEAVRQMAGVGRYWQTSAGRLIAGMKYLGQWEQRCEQVVAECASSGGVLCLDHLLSLARLGGTTPGSSLAAFFLPYLQRGELRMVAEATPGELDAIRRLLPGLADVFQVLPIPELTRQQALGVLTALCAAHSANTQIETGRGLPELAYNLYRRFLPYGAFPGAAARFLSEVFESARQEKASEAATDRVLALFIRRTGLPEWLLRDETPLDQDEMAARFREQVHGQEEACAAAAAVVTAFKAGMNDPGRPVAALLFCGPTGVGKTEMAKALAKCLFGAGEDKGRLVRLDMSEYGLPGAGQRLLSRPDGQPGELVRRVREQPFVVLLLDEIEKADPEVFDVLMGVLDEGRLTDQEGKLTLFRSCVVVMTSNLGARRASVFGFGPAPRADYRAEAMRFFRPEFFNRIDDVVTFGPLGPETIRGIARKELNEVAQREGLARLGLRLEWTAGVEDHLARVGFDAELGARPLQRALEQEVVAPLARWLLAHPRREGVVRLDVGPSGLAIEG
ncbi:MAG: AAA family ATPase [Gemmataceae bacterium]|nr:AAA family ATPase [Gemmataceae bacterium]